MSSLEALTLLNIWLSLLFTTTMASPSPMELFALQVYTPQSVWLTCVVILININIIIIIYIIIITCLISSTDCMLLSSPCADWALSTVYFSPGLSSNTSHMIHDTLYT